LEKAIKAAADIDTNKFN